MKRFSAFLLSLALLLLLTACRGEALPPGERLSRLGESGLPLPAYRLYDSLAAIHEEHYMPAGMAESLYDLSGYSELSHAESYAICLSSHKDAFFECALFLATDHTGAAELLSAVSVRRDFLMQKGYIRASEAHIYRADRYVLAVYGPEQKTADALSRAILS